MTTQQEHTAARIEGMFCEGLTYEHVLEAGGRHGWTRDDVKAVLAAREWDLDASGRVPRSKRITTPPGLRRLPAAAAAAAKPARRAPVPARLAEEPPPPAVPEPEPVPAAPKRVPAPRPAAAAPTPPPEPDPVFACSSADCTFVTPCPPGRGPAHCQHPGSRAVTQVVVAPPVDVLAAGLTHPNRRVRARAAAAATAIDQLLDALKASA